MAEDPASTQAGVAPAAAVVTFPVNQELLLKSQRVVRDSSRGAGEEAILAEEAEATFQVDL